MFLERAFFMLTSLVYRKTIQNVLPIGHPTTLSNFDGLFASTIPLVSYLSTQDVPQLLLSLFMDSILLFVFCASFSFVTSLSTFRTSPVAFIPCLPALPPVHLLPLFESPILKPLTPYDHIPADNQYHHEGYTIESNGPKKTLEYLSNFGLLS